jgi:FkbM family methyltransferase
MKVDYLQVGSHIGNTDNDPVFKKITQGMNVILIEPMPKLFNKLIANYNDKVGNNNIEFLNIAVSTYDGMLDLYSYSPPPPNKFVWTKTFEDLTLTWAHQLASVNKNHLEAHRVYNGIVNITVPCKTLNSIIQERNILSIGHLYTDTEGHDYDILMSLDLELVKPRNIIFENTHTDGPLKKGDNYLNLLNKFESNGYRITNENNYDTHMTLS